MKKCSPSYGRFATASMHFRRMDMVFEASWRRWDQFGEAPRTIRLEEVWHRWCIPCWRADGGRGTNRMFQLVWPKESFDGYDRRVQMGPIGMNVEIRARAKKGQTKQGREMETRGVPLSKGKVIGDEIMQAIVDCFWKVSCVIAGLNKVLFVEGKSEPWMMCCLISLTPQGSLSLTGSNYTTTVTIVYKMHSRFLYILSWQQTMASATQMTANSHVDPGRPAASNEVRASTPLDYLLRY